MKKLVIVFLIGIVLYGCGSTKSLLGVDKTPILVHLDLVNVVDDKVKVTINPGAFASDNVSFYIPKTVPGTYSTDNYGQYIESFKAYNYEGAELTVTKGDENTWNIANASALDKVTYFVNDTYDSEGEVESPVFSPAGTNILKGENFMLNLHGFVGYFTGLSEVPYELTIERPSILKPATSLPKKTGIDEIENVDIYTASRYFEVIDNPIMYAKTTPISFRIKDIDVILSVYSPNGVYTAESLKESMQKMMEGQKAFLGDVNSTPQYNILLYLSTLEETDASGFGALEHHTSTVVVLPEQMPKESLEQAMVDVVSHEFFHTLTPLNVHSEEIHYFDFNDPKMSQHLWMYEGTTEYFANLFQIQQSLIDEAEFFDRIVDKVQNSKGYDDSMSFTEMSKNILVDPYKPNYANVYEKGTLINMALDLTIRDLSNGEKGVLWLMKELSKKYGPSTPFKDDVLIDEIADLTYPEVKAFFETHVIGTTPIDYDFYLAKVGLSIAREDQPTGYFLDGDIPYIDVDQNNGNAIFIREGIELNNFFKDLGAKGGDVIKSIDGVAINLESIRPIIGESFGWDANKDISIEVLRAEETIILNGKAGTPLLNAMKLVPLENVSDEHLKLRASWMKG